MSDLFLKNNTRNINTNMNTSESSINVAKILNNTNNYGRPTEPSTYPKNQYSATSSVHNGQFGGNGVSATSSVYNGQFGGNGSSATSSALKINSNDINNLVSMLTSESNTYTSTAELENKLTSLLQNGGNSNSNIASENTEQIEHKMRTIIRNNKYTSTLKGGSANFKALGTVGLLSAAGAYLNRNSVLTETENQSEFNVETLLGKSSAPVYNSSVPSNNVFARSSDVTSTDNLPFTGDLSPTSTNNNNLGLTTTEMPLQMGGSNDDMFFEQFGGDNDALVAFREISKILSETLKISNGPGAKKIAGQLQRDVKAKNPNIKLSDLVSTAKKYLLENKSTYEKMIVKK